MLQMHPTKAWLAGVRYCPSPNFNLRPATTVIDMIVIHGISLPAGKFGGSYIDDLFCNKLNYQAHSSFQALQGLEVSSHILIHRTGEIVQYVGFDKRAWHAGKSTFQGQQNCNDFAIGIELEGTDILAYTNSQYQQLRNLILCLQAYYPAITTPRIVGHSEIAPQRKTDPGSVFDWPRLFQSLRA